MMYNLFSVSWIRKKGFRVVFDEIEDDSRGFCEVIDEANYSATNVAHETKPGLYEAPMRVDVSNCQDTAAAVAGKESSELWHKRLGHISDDDLKKSIAITKSTYIQSEAYTSKDSRSCILGECNRHPGPQIENNENAFKVLDRVCSDVFGPVKVRSFSGSQFFVTLMEEYSWYSMIGFMRRKIHASNSLK